MHLKVNVLGVPIDSISWESALTKLANWAVAKESRYVCICNVHSVVSATRDAEFREVVNEADMATPDGAPVAWMIHHLGYTGQQRISGPDLMWRYCEGTQSSGQSIFLYGSSEDTLAKLRINLRTAFPDLEIAGAISPPFRELSAEEDAAFVEQINSSGAGIVFVSLGCPKQELWMADHKGRIHAVMVGVGAAFGFHAGTLNRAPVWMHDCGFEWLHRLWSEPRRLWKRYLVTNTLFLLGAAKQLMSEKIVGND